MEEGAEDADNADKSSIIKYINHGFTLIYVDFGSLDTTLRQGGRWAGLLREGKKRKSLL